MTEVKHIAVDIGNTLIEPISNDWYMTNCLYKLLMENSCLDNNLDFFYYNIEIAKREMASRIKMISLDEEYDYLMDFYSIAVNYDAIRLDSEKLKNVVSNRMFEENVYIINEELSEYLRSIDNISKGLFSNTYPSVINYLDKQGISKSYLHNCLSFELGAKKPSLRMYDCLLHITGLKHDEILIIDDNAECIKNAESLGFKTVLFDKRNIEKCIKEIEDLI